jgi:hypothetical protein
LIHSLGADVHKIVAFIWIWRLYISFVELEGSP